VIELPGFFMKTTIQKRFLLSTLIAGLGWLLVDPAMAQTFRILHPFSTGSDGGKPQAGLLLSGNTLYGTAYGGGFTSYGTVFKVNSDGSGYRTLYYFTNGNDGALPQAGLVLSGDTLYGTTSEGVNSNYYGTVFKLNTNGTGFKNIYSFTGGTDGSSPRADLILSGNILYGTTEHAGSMNLGTVFRVNTDGTDFTNLCSFASYDPAHGSHGGIPVAGLVLSGNTLYGTAYAGGSTSFGTVFRVNTDGTGFTNLYYFTNGIDGAYPEAPLILSGDTLYGTAATGGSAGDGAAFSGYGTIFKVSTGGLGFKTIYSFTNGSDGAYPQAGLILSGNTLYGTADTGGSSGAGTVFKVNTDGSGFLNLYSFTNGADGANPLAGLVLSSNTLYGTASAGGAGYGTVFSLSLGSASTPARQLTILRAGTNMILSWTSTGFILQSTTNLDPPVVWTPIASGKNSATNPITGTRKFYRLSE
jgi:uncharacterized repeat protein (TIGR03803 family)